MFLSSPVQIVQHLCNTWCVMISARYLPCSPSLHISSWSTILWVVLSPSLELLTHLGSHSVLQYSRFGCTSDLYALFLTLLELILRFLFKNPSVWLALEVTELICAFHLRFWLIFTPKYLICGTEERVWPWREYVCLTGPPGYPGDITLIIEL